MDMKMEELKITVEFKKYVDELYDLYKVAKKNNDDCFIEDMNRIKEDYENKTSGYNKFFHTERNERDDEETILKNIFLQKSKKIPYKYIYDEAVFKKMMSNKLDYYVYIQPTPNNVEYHKKHDGYLFLVLDNYDTMMEYKKKLMLISRMIYKFKNKRVEKKEVKNKFKMFESSDEEKN